MTDDVQSKREAPHVDAVSHLSYDCPECGWSQSTEIEMFSTITRCKGCSAKLSLTAAVDSMEVLE